MFFIQKMKWLRVASVVSLSLIIWCLPVKGHTSSEALIVAQAPAPGAPAPAEAPATAPTPAPAPAAAPAPAPTPAAPAAAAKADPSIEQRIADLEAYVNNAARGSD